MKNFTYYSKHILLSSFLFIILQFNLRANVDTVIVGPNNSFTFSPANFTMNLGDTVLWIWSSGSHTTTSSSIPAGATSWNSSMNSTSTTFMYIPAVTGNYNYVCSPHAAVMTGSFSVVCNLDTSVSVSGSTLMANATQGSYRWVNCDSNYTGIAADTNQSFTPSISGNYALILSNGGCVDTSSCYNITLTSIFEREIEAKIQIAPNPATEQINLLNIKPSSIQQLRVYNISGQIVLEKQRLGLNNQINVSAFENGVYFVELITNDQKRYLSKFVKK